MKYIRQIILIHSILSLTYIKTYAQDINSGVYIDTVSVSDYDTIPEISGHFSHLELKNKHVLGSMHINFDTTDTKKVIDFRNVTTNGMLVDNVHFGQGSIFRLEGVNFYRDDLTLNNLTIESEVLMRDFKIAKNEVLIFFSTFTKGLRIDQGNIGNWLSLGSTFGKQLFLSNVEIDFKLSLRFSELPESLGLRYLQVGGNIDLRGTRLSPQMSIKSQKCVIDLIGTPVDNILFSFENFELYTPEKPDISQFDDYNQIFENLIKKFTASGQLSSLEEVTKQHKRYKYLKDPTQNQYLGMFMNLVNREWNDYGYTKVRIWLWTGGFFIFFWLINWLRFPHIYIHAYSTPSLANAVETRNYNTKAARRNFFNFRALDLSLYYTAIIFFGLKIESANFNFNNRRGVLYIAGQYIVGIICLAYLANFIIVK